MAKTFKIMKIKPISLVAVFLIAGLIYLLLLVGTMNLFCIKDAEGFFSDKDFLFFGVIYQIPLSIISSFVYYRLAKKILGLKAKKRRLIEMNIPLLWFPLSAVHFYFLYLVTSGQVIQTEDGHWLDKNRPAEDEIVDDPSINK